MFESMEKHKLSEAMLGSFLHSKSLDVPDFLADLPLPVVKRINQKFSDIVAFANKFTS